ncbi:MAG: protein kinase [Campylobacteraceae bacterium]|nr:protein kinase [Campylobacteraceae bacterium]
MKNNNIKISAFSLAKRKELKGEDFYDFKIFEDYSISILCDGVSSANEGAYAAKKVSEHLITNFNNRPDNWSIEKSIYTFIESINSILYNKSIQEYERPEYLTTLALVIIKNNRLYATNIGDTRIYLLRENKLQQLSLDHNINKNEHVLSQAIGMKENVDIFYFENNLENNDKILLCTDGLYTLINDDLIKEYINGGAYSLVKKASYDFNEDLYDDCSAIVINILKKDEISILKEKKLDIPIKIKSSDVIDGYKLKKSLVQNNRTWLCEKNSINYIIKFPLLEASDNEYILDLFIKELFYAKRLKSDFFPEIIIPINRSSVYYIMVPIEGITLKEYLINDSLSIDDSITLCHTLLLMSQYLLTFDLVHGDIKADNIMIYSKNGKNIFKIIDFGSICEIYSISNKSGTASYLAPERFQESCINEKSEIFSIGITIYESLTNRYPYGEIEAFQNPIFKDAKGPKIYNNKIPNWLNSLILRAITHDTEKRYSNYSYMLYELNNPLKVKSFFNKNTPLLKKNPLLFYKYSFYILLIINSIILLNIL